MNRAARYLVAAHAALVPALVAAQAERCAANFADAGVLLGRMHFARTWREVTMDDGKPLTLQISGEGAGLRMAFVKSGEGLWAEGPVRVCRRAARVVAAIAGTDLTLGPAANWAMRQLFAAGATFELVMRENGRLRVDTTGWSGEFEMLQESVDAEATLSRHFRGETRSTPAGR